MVLTFEIDKIKPGVYRTAALYRGIEVAEPSFYDSIEEAIRETASAVPDGFAHFADVTYGGASSGTIALILLPERASQIADQLVAIVAEMHFISEA